MKGIWLYFDVTCSLNNFSWNVDVNPSKNKKRRATTNHTHCWTRHLCWRSGPSSRTL